MDSTAVVIWCHTSRDQSWGGKIQTSLVPFTIFYYQLINSWTSPTIKMKWSRDRVLTCSYMRNLTCGS
jgi:hypothetical protein